MFRITEKKNIIIIYFMAMFGICCYNASFADNVDVGKNIDLFAPDRQRPTLMGESTAITNVEGKQIIEVKGHQFGFKITEDVFCGKDTKVKWSWKKSAGKVCILQLSIVNPETGVQRYFGYGAGSISESVTRDPTVEIFVSDKLPTEWTTVSRNIVDDVKSILGWKSIQIREVYLSPWDGEPGWFSELVLENVYSSNVTAVAGTSLTALEKIGKGKYTPPALKQLGEMRELKFDTHFEELAPGRNSASNEWSTFGYPGNQDFNNLGREMRVRYPAYDLIFRLYDNGKEISPDQLDSFRLGLVNKNIPGIWGGWDYKGLKYKVSVVSIPFGDKGAYDLYRLDVANPTSSTIESLLCAGVDGPPDMKLNDRLLTGLGDASFLLADKPGSTRMITRDWGLCDKRAKSYNTGGGPGETEPTIASTRIGMDGLPVVYRIKVDASTEYVISLVASPHINHLLPQPVKTGDLVFRYTVEGVDKPVDIDWTTYVTEKPRPLYAEFSGAHDVDGDGYIQVAASNAPESRIKHTRLSAVYVFPSGTKISNQESVYNGSMNAACVQHVDVGVTPEVDWANQLYNMTDTGLCRFAFDYTGSVQPGETKTYWLKVPPIHRREPVSMGSYAHAFLNVLPVEAVPPFNSQQISKLLALDSANEWKKIIGYWDSFYRGMASIVTPDPVLEDMFQSRISTRHILDVNIKEDVWFNTCSPWFYYDFAYRDQAYVVYAYDLAGKHDLAERLLDVYYKDVKDVPKGPISFGEVPLQLGMTPEGLWYTRPGQFDTQGENIWCMSQHYKLSGDKDWLSKKAYPFIKRGAQWIVNSRRKHMAEIKDPNDPRYGLIEPGAMEVGAISKGMHMYYMDAWAILGLNEAADSALSLGLQKDHDVFAKEASELKACLLKSMKQTFRRTGLYEGRLWYGVENEGDGMYGMWGHTPLVWPTAAVDPHDPLLTATWRSMERSSNQWGGGIHSESEGGCWPYIGVDWAISYIMRGDPERTLDYFCAFTDTAGLTYSWGEGYENGRNTSAGDQPHFWADAQWVNLYRHLFVMEDGDTLMLTPASLRRWQSDAKGVSIKQMPTQFGDLDLNIKPTIMGKKIIYTFKLAPKGDQANRRLDKIVINARTPGGRKLVSVSINGKPTDDFLHETVIIKKPKRNREYRLVMVVAD
ncbi:MAG: hypothetical protein ACYC0V_11370 [Armatimonadota bacterium]